MLKKSIIAFGIILCLLFLPACNFFYWKESVVNECEKEKWIKSSGDSKQKYLIGMQSGEVYEITDSIFKWQWRSSDIYNSIDANKCYDFTVFGWRIGFLSMYKVIYRADEVKTAETTEKILEENISKET